MSVNLSDFESGVLRLLIIWIRLMTIYNEFPNQMKKGKHETLVRGMLRENTVQHLHSFLKIRNDLLREPDFRDLDTILRPLVDPILQYKRPIHLLRNEYIAHIQDKGNKFKLLINDIISRYQFPTNFAFYCLMAGLAYFYCGIVEQNFKKEWDKALKKYEARSGVPLSISSGFKLNDVQKKLGRIVNPIHIELVDNGFKTEVSKSNIEKLRKIYSKP